jgi:hypothetical protein
VGHRSLCGFGVGTTIYRSAYPQVYNRQKHLFTTHFPPNLTKGPDVSVSSLYFLVAAAKEQPIYVMQEANSALDILFECSDKQRMATGVSLQRIASPVIMQQKFGMS